MTRLALYLREDEVAALVSWADANSAVQAALIAHAAGDGTAHNRLRQRVPGRGGVLNVMAGGVAAAGFFGLKTYTVGFAGQAPHVLVLLYEQETGQLAAVVQGNCLSDLRTGALSTAGVQAMVNPGPLRVGVYGSGRQARAALCSLAAARTLAGVTVYSRTAAPLADFCRRMSAELAVPVLAATAPEQAARGADVILTATTADTPVLLSEWVEAGAHISAIGANAGHRRELADTLVRRCTVVAVDDPEQARQDCGDLRALGPDLDWSRVHHVGALLAGGGPVRRAPAEITLFDSVGVAIADIATGALAYRRALAAGAGTQLPL